MSNAPRLKEAINLPDEIIQAGLNAELILFVGSGISRLSELPSWENLADKVLDELREKEFINFSEVNQLSALDPRKKLSIANLIAEKKRYNLNLTKHIKGKNKSDTVYKAINDTGCPCVTTNYDEMLEPSFLEDKNGSTTAPLNRVYERRKFDKELLSKPGTVVHLHGSVSKPDTMIVATNDYLKHYDCKKVKNLLDALFSKHTVLFLGYGLEEAEILEHILRKGHAKKKNGAETMFALQGFFGTQKYLYESLYNYYKKSFGVQLLGFLRDNEDYKCQERIIKEWMGRLEIRKRTLFDRRQDMIGILKNG